MRIIANSLPKSGTHLLVKTLELLGLTKQEMGLTGALIRPTSRNIFNRIKVNRRRSLGFDDSDSFSIDLDDINNKVSEAYLRQYLDSIKDNHFVTAHLPYSYRLESYLLDKGFKMIYIVRDPRDVLVSLYNYHKKTFKPYSKELKNINVEKGISNIYNGISRRNANLSPLSNRVKNSIGWFHSSSTPLKFEELIGAKGGSTNKLQFESLNKLISDLGLSDKYDPAKVQGLIFDKSAKTFNKGTVEQYKLSLSISQINEIESDMKNEMKVLGY